MQTSKLQDVTFGERVSALSRNQRDAFEHACDAVEESLVGSPDDLKPCFAAIPATSPLRELVLVNLGRCWLEGIGMSVESKRSVADFLILCPEIGPFDWAVEELNAYEECLVGECRRGPGETLSGCVSGDDSSVGSKKNAKERPPKNFSLPPGYKLIKQFSRSGMGLVFLVNNENLNRPEVIKTIKAEYFTDSELLKRFRSEALKRVHSQKGVTQSGIDDSISSF
jgi:hypothetical protein